jgi:hypothetical protein
LRTRAGIGEEDDPIRRPIGSDLLRERSALVKSIKRLCKSAVRSSIGIARRSGALRRLLDEGALESVVLDPRLYEGRPWDDLDRVYTICRRQLRARPEWRYGPARVYEVAKEGFEAVRPYISLDDQVCCDLGCGVYHPYGVSAILYLNGARSTIALDRDDSDQPRAAEALADLLLDCLSSPDRWHWSGSERSDFLQRAHQFGLPTLQEGRLGGAWRASPCGIS